ncbi:MAG: hypothetical protein KDD48_06640, partial [Bdellovibrionales bacterium]|nr:hypothetical protein [Bdellovibrionales bacterium]
SNTRKLLQKISPSNEFTVLADQIDAFQIEYGFKTSGENPRFTRNPKIVSKASLSAKNNPSPCYKPLKNNLKYILLRLRIQGENFERLAYL